MGCTKSKATAAAPVTQQVAENTANLLAPAEQKAVEPKTEEAKAEAPAGATVQISIASAHGLRAADVLGKKSDVFVEVSIEGKPESTITTAVVSGKAASRVGAAEGEKESVEVDLNFDGELKNFAPGDRLVFTVKDKDLVSSDCLGKAVVADGSFGGRLDLESAGDGYTAFLMVQVGQGSAMTAAMESATDAAERFKQALASALGVETVGALQETTNDAEVKSSSMWCGGC